MTEPHAKANRGCEKGPVPPPAPDAVGIAISLGGIVLSAVAVAVVVAADAAGGTPAGPGLLLLASATGDLALGVCAGSCVAIVLGLLILQSGAAVPALVGAGLFVPPLPARALSGPLTARSWLLARLLVRLMATLLGLTPLIVAFLVVYDALPGIMAFSTLNG